LRIIIGAFVTTQRIKDILLLKPTPSTGGIRFAGVKVLTAPFVTAISS